MNRKAYLLRRGSVYWVHRRFPSDVRPQLGRFFRKTLGTSDIKVARARRDLVMAEYHRLIQEARKQAPDPYLIALAKEHRKGALVEVDEKDPGLRQQVADLVFHDIVERYMEQLPNADLGQARAAFRIAEAQDEPLLSDLVDRYLAEITGELTAQTVDEKKRHLKAYQGWLGHDVPIGDVLDADRAYDYLQHLLGLRHSHETKSKRLNNVRGFVDWCMMRGICRTNPFAGLKVRTTKGRKGKKRDRRAWEDDELQRLLQDLSEQALNSSWREARVNARKLVAMAIIGAYSGLRIGELCALETKDVGRGGFHVPESKTEAGVRTTPIHSAIQPLVNSLKEQTTDGFLIPELSPGGPDNKRSWQIQKAFGRRKKALGFGNDLVFHSLRYSFITKLKRGGVPAILLKDVVGHAHDDITFGHYSEDSLIRDKQQAVEKAVYSFDLLHYARKVGLLS